MNTVESSVVLYVEFELDWKMDSWALNLGEYMTFFLQLRHRFFL